MVVEVKVLPFSDVLSHVVSCVAYLGTRQRSAEAVGDTTRRYLELDSLEPTQEKRR